MIGLGDEDCGSTLGEEGNGVLHVICLHHRLRNLARFGKRTLEVFRKLAYAKTVAEVAEVKSQSAFRDLPDAARAALNSVPDQEQYLASAAAAGAFMFGKTTSQAVESQNSALLKCTSAACRSLDLFSSLLEAVHLEKKRYDKWAIESERVPSCRTTER